MSKRRPKHFTAQRDDVWIVCGTRTATDYDQVRSVLDRVRDHRGLPMRLFHGDGPGKPGVDKLAAQWADNQARPPVIKVVAYPPKGRWPQAFHVRNRSMAVDASAFRRPRCIALPGVGIPSKGTGNMVMEAAARGIPGFVFPIHVDEGKGSAIGCMSCFDTVEDIETNSGCTCGRIEI